MSDYKLRQLIQRKRDGEELDPDEIKYFVESVKKVVTGSTDAPDRCQIGAMLMALYLKGMSDTEIKELTLSMRDSGRVFQWPRELQSRMVDKHSTGGVGDKISLVLVPALAACNLRVPMISGRSLGHTGGTLDKLEAVRGCTVGLSDSEIYDCVVQEGGPGCCIAGQTEDCVPADQVLYECRDRTATVDCPSLIIPSIVSKKLSENLGALVYDVKFGKGSFFKTSEDAVETAKGLVKASSSVKSVALLTSMEAPIGRAVGDALEVLEAVECLKGRGPEDVIQLVKALGQELLQLTGIEGNISEVLKNGSALKRFEQMLLKQHANEEAVRDLCQGAAQTAFRRDHQPVNITEISYHGPDGFVSSIDSYTLGNIWKEEYSLSDKNPHVGFLILKTEGDVITSGDRWLQFHHQQKEIPKKALEALSNAVSVSQQRIKRKLIEKRIFIKDREVIVEDY